MDSFWRLFLPHLPRKDELVWSKTGNLLIILKKLPILFVFSCSKKPAIKLMKKKEFLKYLHRLTFSHCFFPMTIPSTPRIFYIHKMVAGPFQYSPFFKSNFSFVMIIMVFLLKSNLKKSNRMWIKSCHLIIFTGLAWKTSLKKAINKTKII